MRGGPFLAIVGAGAILSSCSLAPPYKTPSIETPAAFKEAGPWAPAVPNDAGPKGEWWTAFQDPLLDQLERQVDANNPTLAAALAAYERARAFAAEAAANLGPTIGGVDANTYNRQSEERPLRGARQPNEYVVNTIGAQINYELDFWGRLRNLASSGKALAEASLADLATARLSLHADLAVDYLQLRGLDAQSDLLVATVKTYERALTLTQARHQGGVASGLDVDRAATQLASAKAQLEDVAAARALLEHAVASLVGRPAPVFSVAAAHERRVIPPMPTALPATLLERRPDVAAAERRAFAANRQIGVARAAYYPQITLNGQFGWQNTGGNFLLTAPDTFWTLGPQLALTLFDGGYRRAAVAAARAGFDQASANYRTVVLTAFQQVEDEFAQARHFAVEAEHEAEAVRAAQATTKLSLIRYREGATNFLDVVLAQTAELQAEQAALRLETKRQQVSVDLVRVLGGGWTTEDKAAWPSEVRIGSKEGGPAHDARAQLEPRRPPDIAMAGAGAQARRTIVPGPASSNRNANP